MAYDNPMTVTYSLGSHTTTNALDTSIRGPKGRRGVVRDIVFNCTTTHVHGTTPTKYEIGDGTDDDAYASWVPSEATAPDSLAASADGGTLTGATIDADEVVTVKSVANATGSPAGVGRVDVIVDWF